MSDVPDTTLAWVDRVLARLTTAAAAACLWALSALAVLAAGSVR